MEGYEYESVDPFASIDETLGQAVGPLFKWLDKGSEAVFMEVRESLLTMLGIGFVTFAGLYFCLYYLLVPAIFYFCPIKRMADLEGPRILWASAVSRMIHTSLTVGYWAVIVARHGVWPFSGVVFTFDFAQAYFTAISATFYLSDIPNTIKRGQHDPVKGYSGHTILRNVAAAMVLVSGIFYPTSLSARIFFLLSLGGIHQYADALLDFVAEAKAELVARFPNCLPTIMIFSTVLGAARVVTTGAATVVALKWLMDVQPWVFDDVEKYGVPEVAQRLSRFYTVVVAGGMIGMLTQDTQILRARISSYQDIASDVKQRRGERPAAAGAANGSKPEGRKPKGPAGKGGRAEKKRA